MRFIVVRFPFINSGNGMDEEPPFRVYLYTANNSLSIDSILNPLPRELYISSSAINFTNALSIIIVILLSIKIQLNFLTT
jgi:hypothetical protein